MIKIIGISTLLLFLLAFISGNAQVNTNLNNADKITNNGKYNKTYKSQIDFEVPKKDIKELLEKEKADYASTNVNRPFRLATAIPVDIDIAKQINWSFENEFAFGKYLIRLNGALSASINFDKFFLPPNSEMYIYNENGNMITGPITENENNPNNIWGSWVYKGEYLNIEIRTPVLTYRELILHSNNIAYGYKQIYKDRVGGFGTSESCNINVICPLGAGWEAERNSVALVLNDNGQDWCTGAMAMNTCNTNRPFFLTANHCFTGQNVSAWRFTFQAWSPTCPHPGINNDGVTYNGSTLKANWAGSDFCLVELNNTPPSNSGINYSGWNRSSTSALNGTGIHHPNGDVMKICRDANPIIRSGGGYYNNATHWQVSWNQGITAVGSSGSPLFDQNHRVIGQLHGGTSFCSTPNAPDWYGSFDQSWTGGGTNSTRLSNWLDPNNTGAMTTNTTNVSGLVPHISNLTISGNHNFCNTGTYTVSASNGFPPGTTIVWSILPANSATLTPNGNQVTVTPSWGAGNAMLTATLTNACGATSTQAQKQITTALPDHIVDVLDGAMPLEDAYIPMNTSLSLGTRATEPYPYYPYYLETPYLNASTASYIWQVHFTDPYGGHIWYNLGTHGYGYTPPFIFDQYGQYEITVDIVNNSCVSHGRYFTRQIIFINPYGKFSVSPNPSSGNIKIQPPVSTIGKTSQKPLEIRKIELIDKMGAVRHIQNFGNGLTTVNLFVNQLPNDIYTLRIFDGAKWHSHKLVIQH